ncbi:hypothetical protein HK098_000474 [Nowakowskiella sp. JEL0407]|nr:hypothetical protein HK098_000474 [Nowakowskiella sp. JEL0407]
MFRLLKYPSKDSKDNMLVMQADFSSQYYYTPYSLIRKVFKRLRRLFFFDFCRVAGLVLISVGYLIVYNRKDDACLYKSSIGYVKMELFISGMVLISIGCLRIVSVLIPQPSRGRLKKVLSFSEYIETVRANIPQIRYHAHCYGREMVETEYGVQEHDVTVHSDSYSFKLSSEDKSIIRDPPKFGLIVLVCDRKLEWGDNATREHYETTLLNFHGKCKTSDISTERTMLFLYDCGYDSENKLLCYSTKLKPWYLDRNFYLFMSIIGLGYFYEMWLEWISQEMHITFKKVIRFEIE